MEDKEILIESLKAVAPGTKLRTGLDNILRSKRGALIVIGDSEEIMDIVEGGFTINCDLTSSALYELAKMDGAIIINSDMTKIIRANAHLHPQVSIPSRETGIRHRIAQRVARQTGALVIAISEARSIITLYRGRMKYVLSDISFLLTKANQAVQTLEKYTVRMEEALEHLSALEFKNMVTVEDVARVLQKAALILKIVEELEIFIVQLGTEGRMVDMQLEELYWGLKDEIILVLKDYYRYDEGQPFQGWEEALQYILNNSREELIDILEVSKILGYGSNVAGLHKAVVPKGYRLLNKVVRIPSHVADNLAEAFGTLPNLMNAKISELIEVDGIGEVRARAIKEGLGNLRKTILSNE
ncbi:MAG: DNA integrity scanning protein DisA [Clostridia bacterium]|nr:DNA integrity scanning protein DisA [Clostridia bacterium]